MLSSSSPLILSSLLILLSLPVLFLLAPRILPPKTLPAISLPDELDDLALFRRATLAADDPGSPSSVDPTALVGGNGRSRRRLPPPPPKIAFLFLTNSDLFFAPLWERFFRGHVKFYNIYVHADPTVPITPPSGVFRDRLIPGKATQRASPTLISAARRLLAAALLDDPSNTFFALVSQHCVPLHSFRFVYHALFADTPPSLSSSKSSSDPSFASLYYPGRRHRRPRYRSFIEILAGDPGLWDRYVARGDDVMMPEVSFDQFRVGSQFFVLTRRHAVLVVRDRRLWKKFRMPCLKSREDSCYPEEHYFPTLLSMQDPGGCSHYTLTRVNWTGSVGGHPHTYRPGEVSADLVRELRRSNSTYSYLFARKFSPDCLHSLLEIADTVVFRD